MKDRDGRPHRPPNSRFRWSHLLSLIGIAFLAAAGTFAAIAAGIFLPSEGPPSSIQLALAILGSVATGIVTFLQLNREPTPRAPDQSASQSGSKVLDNSSRPDNGDSWVPRVESQLPPDVADFTGRASEVVLFERLVKEAADRKRTAPLIVIISGAAGVGKTTFAVHMAHRIREQFPDGQLYADLHGHRSRVLAPGRILAGFLRSLGTPSGAIPEVMDERSRLFRSRVARRRLLLLLDNASNEKQLRPLLPGSATCAVLITSRNRLMGLESAHRLPLKVLERQSATELLGKIIGEERISSDTNAAHEIVDLCGGLPLAVRIAGARLAEKSHWPLSYLANRMRDERNRLNELTAGDLEVRSSFRLMYTSRSKDEQRAFRMLGLLPSLDFAPWLAAALLNTTEASAREMLERLVEAQLLEVAIQDSKLGIRYRFHDLLRALSREQLHAEETLDARRTAFTRVAHAYIALANAVDAEMEPSGGIRDPEGITASTHIAIEQQWDDSLEQLLVERPGVLATVEAAHREGLWQLTLQLTNALTNFLSVCAYFDDWQRSSELALDAARQANNLRAEAYVLRSMGDICRYRGQWANAIQFSSQALGLFEQLDDAHAAACVTRDLGIIHKYEGDFEGAVDCFQRAMASFHHLGDRHWVGYTLRSLGETYRAQGNLSEAIAVLCKSKEVLSTLGDVHWEAASLLRLGEAYASKGLYGKAVDCYDRASRVFRQFRSRLWIARVLTSWGDVAKARGQGQLAIEKWRQALEILRNLESHEALEVEARLSGAHPVGWR